MASQPPELRDVPDEVLERLGLTRERWEAIQKEILEREARAPNVGDTAADFELPVLGDPERTVRLSSFRDKRPVALVFGSYT
ncbi:MAG: hypothetical protein IIB87_04635 [Chloroflexi bacterium]|nr:hypothetical protein [Chloroflexota bacterium]